MDGRFEITFPLVLDWDGALGISFSLESGNAIDLGHGLVYLKGDNGSGKTSFVNLLSLTAGRIGCGGSEGGTIRFNETVYSEKGFDHLAAAKLRETYFSIFPQKTFFLPVSVRENYLLLNGSDPEKARRFSGLQMPDLLSGGQQQKILMDIVLDVRRPVWFLDEPLSNLDAGRRLYFWKTLKKGFDRRLQTAFFIDHSMGEQIASDSQFHRVNTLRVFTENRRTGFAGTVENKQIGLYVNPAPAGFLDRQIQKATAEQAAAASRVPADRSGP